MTIYTDVLHTTKSAVALNAQAYATATDVSGEIVDFQGFDCGKITTQIGTYATGTCVLKQINESDDAGMAGAVAITGDRLMGTIASLSSAKALNEVGFVNAKRYIQAVWTMAGTVSFVASAQYEKAGADILPVQ